MINIPKEVKAYLYTPIPTPGLLILLMLGLLYERLNAIYYSSKLVIYTLISGLIFLWLRFPRWIVYATFMIMVTRQIHLYTMQYSKLDYDITSTRDEAVEATTRAFLNGKNPWSHVQVGPPNAKVPASTGPASILLAIPFILIFDEINWLTFSFWMAFICVLLFADVHLQNNSFPFLVLLFSAGVFHFNITMQMSLDEFYYPYLLFVLAYVLVIRRKYLGAGIALFSTAFFRINYLYGILGFLLWLFLAKNELNKMIWVKLGLGGFLISSLILTPFILFGRDEFFLHNSFRFAFSLSAISSWLDNNVIFIGLNFISSRFGQEGMRWFKPVLTIGLMTLLSLRLRNTSHPFWNITIAAFLTITIAWYPPYSPIDYELFPLLPAFLAVAFTPVNLLGTKSNLS